MDVVTLIGEVFRFASVAIGGYFIVRIYTATRRDRRLSEKIRRLENAFWIYRLAAMEDDKGRRYDLVLEATKALLGDDYPRDEESEGAKEKNE